MLRKEIFWSGSATVVVASLPDLSLIRYKNWTKSYVWYLPNRIIVITRLYKFGFFEFGLRVIIPREEQGIKEFDDKEFLTRKTDKENKEFTSIKKALLRLKLSFRRGKNTKICYLKNIYA